MRRLFFLVLLLLLLLLLPPLRRRVADGVVVLVVHGVVTVVVVVVVVVSSTELWLLRAAAAAAAAATAAAAWAGTAEPVPVPAAGHWGLTEGFPRGVVMWVGAWIRCRRLHDDGLLPQIDDSKPSSGLRAAAIEGSGMVAPNPITWPSLGPKATSILAIDFRSSR